MGERFEILFSLTFWLKDFLYGYVPLNEVGLVSNTTNQPTNIHVKQGYLKRLVSNII